MLAPIYDPEFAHLASGIDYDAISSVHYEVPSPPPMPAKCRHAFWNGRLEDPFETIEDQWTNSMVQQDDCVQLEAGRYLQSTLGVSSPKASVSVQAASPQCSARSNVKHTAKCKSQLDTHREVHSAQNYPHTTTPVDTFEESQAEVSRSNQERRTNSLSSGIASECSIPPAARLQASFVQGLKHSNANSRTGEDATQNHIFAEQLAIDAGTTSRHELNPKTLVLRQQKPIQAREILQQLPMVTESFRSYEQAPHVDLLVGQDNAVSYLPRSSPHPVERRHSFQVDDKRSMVIAAHSDDSDSIVMMTASKLYVAGKYGSFARGSTKESKGSHIQGFSIDGNRPPGYPRRIGRGSVVGENIKRTPLVKEEQHKPSVPTSMKYDRTTSLDPQAHRDCAFHDALSVSTSSCLVHQETALPKTDSNHNHTRFSWAYYAMRFPTEKENSSQLSALCGGFHPKLLGRQSGHSRWNLEDSRRDLDSANAESQKSKVANALPAYSLLHRHNIDTGVVRKEASTEADQLELAFNVTGAFVASRPQTTSAVTSSRRQKSADSALQPQNSEATAGTRGVSRHRTLSKPAICSSPAVLLTKPIVARKVIQTQRANPINAVRALKKSLTYHGNTRSINSTLAAYGNHKFWNAPAIETSKLSLERSIEASSNQKSRSVHPIKKDYMLRPFSPPHTAANHKVQYPDRKKVKPSPVQILPPS